MGEVKHTPGPWKLDDLTYWLWAVDPYGHGNMHVADVTIRGWRHLTGASACNKGGDEAAAIQQANARLIAAAPDLLEALQGLLYLNCPLTGNPSYETLVRHWNYEKSVGNESADYNLRAIDAVAKATGAAS